MSELILGCGSRRDKEKIIKFDGIPELYENPTYLDIMPDHKPDVVWDMNNIPLPFDDNSFSEIHAYEILEHCGQQGDWKFFFKQFEDFWRILKPGGYICGSVPMWDNEWAWGDPGHTRVITANTLLFLEQDFYKEEIGKTTASDYRSVYKADFKYLGRLEKDVNFFFVLQAKK